ncbi:flagellar hook capping FlgD N-terminal domain-containing protein [Pseudooceanicola sp. 502str34]
MTDAITSAAAAQQVSNTGANVAASAQAGAILSSDFQTFLNMMATQLTNQDPLDPVDADDFAVQLATFSGVEQQVLTNQLLESLHGQMAVSSLAQTSGWVGMEARSLAPAYWEGDAVTLSPNPLAAAEAAFVVVRNESGTQMARFEVPVSADPVTWDGTDDSGAVLPYGYYSFELENIIDDAVAATDRMETYGLITESQSQNGTLLLVLKGGGRILMEDVTGLRRPVDTV